MKLTRSSIAQLSRQDIDWSSQPTENCHPSIRSTLLPIYPVWTRATFSHKGRREENSKPSIARESSRLGAILGETQMVADSSSEIAWHRAQIRKHREALKHFETAGFTFGRIAGPKAADQTQKH